VSFKPAAADQAMTAMMSQPQSLPQGMDPEIFFAPAGHIAPPAAWVAGANTSDPMSVTDSVLNMVVQGDATIAQQGDILSYIVHDGVGNRVVLNGENFEEKVRGAVSLAMALPPYQLA